MLLLTRAISHRSWKSKFCRTRTLILSCIPLAVEVVSWSYTARSSFKLTFPTVGRASGVATNGAKSRGGRPQTADARSSASSGVVSTTPAHHEKRRSTPRPFPSSSRYCYEYGGRACRPSGAVHRVSPAGTDHGTGLRTPSACQHNAPPTARKNPRLFTSPRPGFRSTGKQYALTGSHGPQRSHLTKAGGSPDAS
jgi:hypothetical protein